MIRVLFVCLGNICRSPMAEAVFRKMIKEEQLEGVISVDSAATSDWHIGKPPHEGTLSKLREYDISTEGMACRQLQGHDIDKFDYIIGMDSSNLSNMKEILNVDSDPKITRLLDLTEHRKDLPDPYYTGNFQETYDLVTDGCLALLEKVKEDINN